MRAELEEREKLALAVYAQFSSQSRGREHDETPPEWRTDFQRDRDRIIHSRAFRRLEYKTQVFLNGTGDHLRTRLTHTMEVAAIARNLARPLRLNEDLAEAIALAHDLGHSPFGHNGEKVLDGLLRKHGGFEHNQQSLRVVEVLEQKYPRFPGLNLSWEVREGLAKHHTLCDRSGTKFRNHSLEAQVANVGDEIAYYSHDLDDGLDAGLLSEKRLTREVEVWRLAAREVQKEHGKLPDECRRFFTIRCLIDAQVRDVVETTERAIQAAKVRCADDGRAHTRPLVRYSPQRRALNLELRKYLYQHLYFNRAVHAVNQRAAGLLKDLFQHFLQHPAQLPEQALRRVEADGLHRAICDHLAGMTDRYALQEHDRLFG